MRRSYDDGALTPDDQALIDEFGTAPDDIAEIADLCRAVNRFAHMMKRKLGEKRREGFRGWDAVDVDSHVGAGTRCAEHLAQMLQGKPDQEVDVANFAMFRFFIEEELRANAKLEHKAGIAACIEALEREKRGVPRRQPGGPFERDERGL